MPAKARKDIVNHEEIGLYHCFSRCVRRAFLTGVDRRTGKDFSYRLEWFDIRMQQLAAVFMIEIVAYAFLDNHFHSMLRNRPDLAKKLSDREVARRSLMISPNWMPDEAQLAEPDEEAIQAAMQDKERIRKWRERLGSLSWFMKCLKEPIARRANLEDEVTGCFWESRFRSTRLLDAMAALACSMYVDLNEVRAEKSDSPDTSQNSSIGQRIAAWVDARKQKYQAFDKLAWETSVSDPREPAPAWVSPVNVASDNGTVSGTMTEESPKPHGKRASDSGFLPMTIEQYMLLVDWAGRCEQEGKREAIPKQLAPIMDRLIANYDAFLLAVKDFGKLFRSFCGSPESLLAHGEKMGLKKIHGISMARKICDRK